MAALAAEPQPLRIVDHRRDHVGVEIVLEGGAQIALLAALGHVAVSGQHHVGEKCGGQRQNHVDQHAVVDQAILRVRRKADDHPQRGRRRP